MTQLYEDEFNPDDLSVRVSELLVATADESDELIDSAVTDVLSLLRERLAMDVVFVSEFLDGQRVFRYVEAQDSSNVPTVGDGDPLETTWCQRVVNGRLPPIFRMSASFRIKHSYRQRPSPWVLI